MPPLPFCQGGQGGHTMPFWLGIQKRGEKGKKKKRRKKEKKERGKKMEEQLGARGAYNVFFVWDKKGKRKKKTKKWGKEKGKKIGEKSWGQRNREARHRGHTMPFL